MDNGSRFLLKYISLHAIGWKVNTRWGKLRWQRIWEIESEREGETKWERIVSKLDETRQSSKLQTMASLCVWMKWGANAFRSIHDSNEMNLGWEYNAFSKQRATQKIITSKTYYCTTYLPIVFLAWKCLVLYVLSSFSRYFITLVQKYEQRMKTRFKNVRVKIERCGSNKSVGNKWALWISISFFFIFHSSI